MGEEKGIMREKIETTKKELVQILTEYQKLQDNTYDLKIIRLSEQIGILDDILDDELEELLIDWEITLDEDRADHWKYK